MKRNHEIRLKLTKEELEVLKKKAKKIGVPTTTYIRLLALSAKNPITIQ